MNSQFDPPNRGFLHNLGKGIQEWTVGRYNITVADLCIDAGWKLWRALPEPPQNTYFKLEKDAVEVQQALEMTKAARDMVQSWAKKQKLMGGFGNQDPNPAFRTFHGMVKLSALNGSLKEAVRFIESTNEKFRSALEGETEMTPQMAAKLPSLGRDVVLSVEKILRVLAVVDPGRVRCDEYQRLEALVERKKAPAAAPEVDPANN